MTNMRVIRTALILVVGLGIAALIATYQIKNEGGMGTGVQASNFGGDLDLITHTGQPFTHNDFEEDQYRLIYFGFTYCPAICPTELQRMATLIRNLGDKGDQITPYFITVDPERDTVETMANYVALFHPRLIGLTGNQAQIDQAKKAYKIYAAKIQDETMSDYTMDHSSFIYFMDSDNNLLRIFKADDSLDDMTKIVERYLR